MSSDVQGGLGYLVGQLSQRVRRLYEAELAPFRLNMPQYATLTYLAAAPGGLPAAEIARRLHLTPQAVSLLAARLEAAGHVTRAEPTTGRSQPLLLTEAGRDQLVAARGAIVQAEAEAFAPLGANDREALRRLLAACLAPDASGPGPGE
ncbi:MarR family winged helix-turn-helix transcriptional regulator [Streptomyces sp. NPDC056296]|uniref:MarR family winged helix-turn-helix transcriptional regulator n=1 Tax=Streptomyces sp. NPDC056296 TaxID=3345775 RepID=UPI0035DD2EF7